MNPIFHPKILQEMNEKNRRRLLLYLILFLLVLNVSALGTIIYLIYRPHHDLFPPGPDGPVGKRLENELNLSETQRKEFKTLRRDFLEKSRPVLDTLRLTREEIYKGLAMDRVDTVVLFQKADELGRHHAQLKKMAIRHFLRLQSKCSPEQRKRLISIYRPLLESDGPGRGMQYRNRMGPAGTGHGQHRNMQTERNNGN